MSKRKRKPSRETLPAKISKPLPDIVSRRLWEGAFLTALAVSCFLLLALATYSPTDSGWSYVSGQQNGIDNAGGAVGAWFSDVLLYAFGYFAYLFPLILGYASWQLFRGRYGSLDYRVVIVRVLGFCLMLLGGCALANLGYLSHWPMALPDTAGGVVGRLLASGLGIAFNHVGASIFALTMLLAGVTLCTGMSWLNLAEVMGRYTLYLVSNGLSHCLAFKNRAWDYVGQQYQLLREKREHKPAELKSTVAINKVVKERIKPVIIEKPSQANTSKRYEQDRQTSLFEPALTGKMPALNLLEQADKTNSKGYSNTQLEDMSRQVEQRLMDFGVDAQVVAVHPGPVITRFELQLAPGIKVSKISGLAKDLARSLAVVSVRIVEVIPGKPVVGLELPNVHREVVRLGEVLASNQYEQARSSLSLALGVDIAGHPVIVDLAKMPHLLVAGTTGSGKSVGINAMLLSLLFKATPEDVRLILIDPKMLELSVYDGIPHLLAPVVTDMNEAANSLRWGVAEMERRYRLMATLGVRNLTGYNNKVAAAVKKRQPLTDPLWQGALEEAPLLEHLPYIVVVIDELADMMMVVGKKVEQLIARIAQKARAAGIHLILATQRPSVDVLTGLIKSNIPTRIGFQVSSKIDSRTILDQQGADQLLGHGDMLYLAPGSGAPVRVHGALVEDHEVHNVVQDWKQRGEPAYVEEIVSGPEVINEADFAFLGEKSNDTEDADPLYDEAVEFVLHARKVSISSVQRRLRIGYNRAARLVEEMERTGVVSAMDTSGNREVLVPARAD